MRRRSRLRPSRAVGLACALALGFAISCVHRYSEDREDWVGPRKSDFEADLEACQRRMRDAPFRYGGDSRLIFLDCMERRGWHLKGRSYAPSQSLRSSS